MHPRRKLQPADHEGEEGEEMSEHEIILTDKIVKDWIEEIPNMRVATENYPGFSALAHAVVFEVLELSLLELVDLRARIAELEKAVEEAEEVIEEYVTQEGATASAELWRLKKYGKEQK